MRKNESAHRPQKSDLVIARVFEAPLAIVWKLGRAGNSKAVVGATGLYRWVIGSRLYFCCL